MARSSAENVARNSAEAVAKRRAIVLSAKSVPCTDCGDDYPPYVLEFDHCRGQKIRAIGSMISSHRDSIEALLAEIAKCDVVCANCHRARTYNRLGLTDKALAS
jgi:hypothetical protein